jgi:hypothetical protein
MRPPKRSQAGEEWLRCSPQDGEDAPIVFPPPKLRPIPPSRTCGVDADFISRTEIVIRQEFVDQRAGFAQSGRHVLNCAKEDESNGSSETYGHLARLISGRTSRNQMKWQIVSPKVSDKQFPAKETRSICNRCSQRALRCHSQACFWELVFLVSRLRGRAVRQASRDSNQSRGAFVFFHCLFVLANIQHTCEPVNQSQPCRVDSTYIGEKHAFRVRLNANL